jgi:hypothetical protein
MAPWQFPDSLTQIQFSLRGFSLFCRSFDYIRHSTCVFADLSCPLYRYSKMKLAILATLVVSVAAFTSAPLKTAVSNISNQGVSRRLRTSHSVNIVR